MNAYSPSQGLYQEVSVKFMVSPLPGSGAEELHASLQELLIPPSLAYRLVPGQFKVVTSPCPVECHPIH